MLGRKRMVLLLMAMTGVAHAQYKNLVMTPERITATQKFAFTYDAAGTPLENRDSVSCVMYYFSNSSFQWKGLDIALVKDSINRWRGACSAPADIATATFKFMSGDKVDNNDDRSYGMVTAPVGGGDAVGAYAAWGLLRSPGYGFDIPGYLGGKHAISDTVTAYWMERELRSPNMKTKSVFAIPFALSHYKAYKESKLPVINAAIKYLSRNEAPLEDLLKAWYIAQVITGQQAKADSIWQYTAQRYSAANLQKVADYKVFTGEVNGKKSIELAEAFLQKYPYATRIAWFDDLCKIDYNRVYMTAVLGRIEKEDFYSISRNVEQLPYVTTLNVYYKTIEVAHSRKTISDTFLYTYSKMLVRHMEVLEKNQPQEFSFLSPLEWKTKFETGFYANLYRPMLFAHIEICNKTGRYDEALYYARMAQTAHQYRKSDLNDAYVIALQKAGSAQELKEALLKSMYENQASPLIIDLLKADFVKEHQSEEGFGQYLQSLKNAAASKHSAVEAPMLNQAIQNWTMEDENGKKVSLKSLKGKVVVLDFWATWCVPCKASFPGMKLAVENFKNDPNVIFYFVDTEERLNTDYKAQVKKYIKDNNYPFHILFDNATAKKESTGKEFEAICKIFSISGIPQKLIIDANGNVRFVTVGYKGSPSALADELTSMIELVKKQK